MKYFMFLLMIMLAFGGTVGETAFAEGESYVKVLYSSINIFKDSDINLDADGDGEVLDVIADVKHGTKLLVLGNQIEGADGFIYTPIAFEENGVNINAFVLSSQVLSVEISSPQKDLDYNATIIKDAQIYIYEDLRFIELDQKLYSGEKIKILDGYSKEKEYTLIQYKDDGGDIVTAYVKTANIKTSGISRSTIGAIIIIVTIVSLVLVVFGIKGSKKRKKNK